MGFKVFVSAVDIQLGDAWLKEIENALTAGANFCLEKSTDFKELLAKVRALLPAERL